MISLSVVIPIYNTPHYLLDQCMTSILDNIKDMKDVEVLMINDGSNEPHIAPLLEETEQKDGRFRYVDKPNSGVSNTRNLEIRLSQGEYIAFVDADDYLEPDAFQYMLATAKKEQADVAMFGFCCDENRIERETTETEGQKRMVDCITKCKSYLKITDIQINGTPYNQTSLTPHQEVLDVVIKGMTEEPMRCEVRMIIKRFDGTPLANYIPGCYTGELCDIQPEEFTLERHIQLPKYMANGDYVIGMYIHEPWRQDFFEVPECQRMHIEGFYESYTKTIALSKEGFIGLESVIIPDIL